jgi:hypothetical protein
MLFIRASKHGLKLPTLFLKNMISIQTKSRWHLLLHRSSKDTGVQYHNTRWGIKWLAGEVISEKETFSDRYFFSDSNNPSLPICICPYLYLILWKETFSERHFFVTKIILVYWYAFVHIYMWSYVMHMLMLQFLESFKGYVLAIHFVLSYVVLWVQTCIIVFIPHRLLALGQQLYLR